MHVDSVALFLRGLSQRSRGIAGFTPEIRNYTVILLGKVLCDSFPDSVVSSELFKLMSDALNKTNKRNAGIFQSILGGMLCPSFKI